LCRRCQASGKPLHPCERPRPFEACEAKILCRLGLNRPRFAHRLRAHRPSRGVQMFRDRFASRASLPLSLTSACRNFGIQCIFWGEDVRKGGVSWRQRPTSRPTSGNSCYKAR
jgi:hypothetical protein